MRALLRKREPAFAAALAAAAQDFPCPACPRRQPETAMHRLSTILAELGHHLAI